MKVSVIIPVYNVEQYIENCLKSVLSQTYSNIEIILVNDCTPDNSMQIAKNILQSKAIIINHDINKGLSEARNSGIRAATGDYIYFLDSDDTIPSDSIETLVSLCNGCDMSVGGFITGDNKPYFVLYDAKYEHDAYEKYLLGMYYVMACNKLIRRELIIDNSIYFISDLLHEDNPWSYQVAKVCKSVALTSKITYVYNVREGSITTNYTLKNVHDNVRWFNVVEKDIFTHEPTVDELTYLIRNKTDTKIMAIKRAGISYNDYKALEFTNTKYPFKGLNYKMYFKNLLLRMPIGVQYNFIRLVKGKKNNFAENKEIEGKVYDNRKARSK